MDRLESLESEMLLNANVALTWILFLALFPMAFIWLRRAWRIFFKKDYAEVALKRGNPPKNPGRYAPFTALINLVAGVIAVWAIIGVGLGVLRYDTWTAMAGMTLWLKLFADFILSRHAHPFVIKKPGWLRKTASGRV